MKTTKPNTHSISEKACTEEQKKACSYCPNSINPNSINPNSVNPNSVGQNKASCNSAGLHGKSVRSVIFIVVCSLLCFSFFWGYAFFKIAPDNPFLNNKLAGGVKTKETSVTSNQIKANPLGSLVDGAFKELVSVRIEDIVERKIENTIPFKDNLLLYGAGCQRQGIKIANAVFCYEVFPTYFGSHYVCMPSKQVVFPQVKGRNEKDVHFQETLNELANLSTNNQDMRWFFYFVNSPSLNASNPTKKFTGNPVTYQDYLADAKEKLSETGTILDDSCFDLDEFLGNHYVSDHHWNINGAKKSFLKIAHSMNLKDPDWGETVSVCDDNFYGTSARSGIILDYPDRGIEDVLYDISNLVISIDGSLVGASQINYLNNNTNNKYHKKYLAEDLYGSCFHYDYAEIIFTNPDVETGTLLLIGNSYSNQIDRFFTKSYHQVISYDPRHNKRSIQDYIDQYQPDDSMVIWNCAGFQDN